MTAHDVPDLAYGDAPDGFDSPDGRTYSAVTGVTPEQAAYEVRRAAFFEFLASQGYDDQGRFDHDEMELAFETGWQIAQAAIAAQDARPAPVVSALQRKLEDARTALENISLEDGNGYFGQQARGALRAIGDAL